MLIDQQYKVYLLYSFLADGSSILLLVSHMIVLY